VKEKERLIVAGLVALMIILWLGFPFHQSARFAGSLWGGVLGVVGTLLMLVPLLYLIVKRNKRLKKWTTRRISMRTLLAWHIYAGVIGPILVVVHSGHKYQSLLGITLTGMTLVVVVSGFVGRYLMNQFSQEIREKKALLAGLQNAYQQAADALGRAPDRVVSLKRFSGVLSRMLASFFVQDRTLETESIGINSPSPTTLLRLSESIADVEYAIKTHMQFKQWFGKWLKFHIVISIVLYVLMAFHLWAAIHFGLRWFDPWRSSTSYFSRLTVHGSDAVPLFAPANDPAEKRTAEAIEKFSLHFGQLFQQYWHAPVVIHGRKTTVFDYAGIAGEVRRPDSNFSQAARALEQVDASHVGTGDRAKSFWINVYNFGAMKLAAENYPVASITDPKISDGDPWGIRGLRIGTMRLTLHQIENELLLAQFNDPRIVFAVSCAAVSCPDRTQDIFSAEHIDRQLDEVVRRLLANPTKGLVIDRTSHVLRLSWILQADRRLFGNGDDDGLLDFVQRFAVPETRRWLDLNRNDLTIEFFEHDWSLNDIALADKTH